MDGDEERSLLAKVTLLRFIAALSFFSFLYSCFSSAGYNNNFQFSTLVFSLFAHSLDRKCMFLICNGIVAFLVKTFTFSSSSTSIKSAQDSVTQIVETTTLLVQENAASSVEYGVSTVATEEEMEKQQEEMKVEDEDEEKDEDGVVQENIGQEEINVEMKVEDESDYEEEEEEEEVEVEENKGEKEIEVSDAIVSTEELNHKFEEFIRKMKEEIRIEALQQQQQLVAAS